MRDEVKVRRIPVGPLATNCYLVTAGGAALIIDPGEEAETILHHLERSGARLEMIIHTHGHFDHVGAAAQVRDETKAPVYMHGADTFLVKDMGLEPCLPDHDLDGVDELDWAGKKIAIMPTPGHTPGGVSLVVGDNLFTGDTLFAGSVGRTDLPGGSTPVLMESLSLLAGLGDDLVVLPGHGPRTTLPRERAQNPFLADLG